MAKRFLGLALAAAVAGCAAPTTRPVGVSSQAADAEALKQTELAVADMIEKHERLKHVHRILATRAHGLCGEHVGPDIGAHAMTRPAGDAGAVLERLHGIQERLTVLFVLQGSPAAAAGMQPRDVVLSVNGRPAAQAKSLEALHEGLPPEAPIAYRIERAGAPMALSVNPERACSYPVLISASQGVNAFADGKRVAVTRGMINFAAGDRELALVVAHEMAHNAMRHLEARKQNAGLGMLADLAILLLSRGQVSGSGFTQAAAMAYTQQFEAEADYVGLYMLAHAGYPIEDAPLFWRRMAAAHPGSIRGNHAASHPSTSQRMVALEGAVREIQAKQAAAEPLVPNMKDGQPMAASLAASSAPDVPPAPPPESPRRAAPAPGPAPQAAPPARVALAAPGAAPARPAGTPGLPAPGSTWRYEAADRMYAGRRTSFTVRVAQVIGHTVEEQLLAGPNVRLRVIEAPAAAFVAQPAVADAPLVEFAPYFLAANGGGTQALASAASGYPVQRGTPGWVVRMSAPPNWERVTVPAGSFRALRLEFAGERERAPFSPIVTYRFALRVWYAPEVGRYVRLEHEEWLATRQSSHTAVELMSFSPPS